MQRLKKAHAENFTLDQGYEGMVVDVGS